MKIQPFTLTALLATALASTASAMTIISPPNTIDTDTVWDSDTDDDGVIDQIYYLEEAVFVGDFNGGETRPTLTITPGTVIAATGATDGSDGLDVGSLIIAQTGAINAEGTPDAPITFTSVDDAEFTYAVDINGDAALPDSAPEVLGANADGGQWLSLIHI